MPYGASQTNAAFASLCSWYAAVVAYGVDPNPYNGVIGGVQVYPESHHHQSFGTCNTVIGIVMSRT
jgi:hypothetical protein